MTVHIAPEKLLQFARDVLVDAGATGDDAAQVAETLVWADRRGKMTQGVYRLPMITKRLKRALVASPAPMTLERTATATAWLDAANGLGQVAGRRAMDEAVALARESGVGVCAVKDSNHYGAAGYFAALAAEQGMLGFTCSNSMSKVAPHGGRQRLLGTNPLAFACPRENGPPVVIDISTAITTGSLVSRARQRGEQIPPGLALDKDGEDTQDPVAAEDGGALLPAAGPKGFALGLLVEVLSGVLSGAAFAPNVGSMARDMNRPVHCGHLCLAIDIERFGGRDFFAGRIETLLAAIVAVPAREGFESVRVPGAAGARPGDIELSDDLQRSLEGLGLPTPWN
ncbi:MAG: Ldh family oxidoreductase [Planctomycetota bacterium]|jgi:LDH2 family malate/lactate/ureidoglycolate dehydrogenase